MPIYEQRFLVDSLCGCLPMNLYDSQHLLKLLFFAGVIWLYADIICHIGMMLCFVCCYLLFVYVVASTVHPQMGLYYIFPQRFPHPVLPFPDEGSALQAFQVMPLGTTMPGVSPPVSMRWRLVSPHITGNLALWLSEGHICLVFRLTKPIGHHYLHLLEQ